MKLWQYLLIAVLFTLALPTANWALSGGGGGGGAPSGAAGGDLAGTYPNPTVTGGTHIGAGTVPNAALVTAPITACSGDINAGCSSVTKVNGTAFTSGAPAVNELGSIANTGTATCDFTGTNVCHFTIASGASITIGNPTNLPTNQIVFIGFSQAGTGLPTLTWGSNLRYYNATTDAFSAMAGNADPQAFFTNSTGAGSTWMPFWSDGTTLSLLAGAGNRVQLSGVLTRSLQVIGGVGDNAVQSMPRMPLTFPISAVAATTTTQWGEQKLTKASTIENIVVSVGAFTCSVNPVLKLQDCGTTAGTCTPTATTGTSATLTAIGNADITVSTAAVAAGHYMAVQFSAGTCTVFNGSITAMARPQ